MFLCRLLVDSPNCAKTLGLTFSCQAAAAEATNAASRTQRSSSMTLVTSRHHLGTLAARGCSRHRQAGRSAAGGRLAAGSRGRGARLRGRRPAVSHAWGCGVRTSHVTQPSSPPAHPRRLSPTLRRHNRVKKAPAYPNERRH